MTGAVLQGLRITRAHRWDAPAVARILSDAVDEPIWMRRTRSRAEEARIARDLIARGWVRVARLRGRVVGFIAVGEGCVHGLYLSQAHRGRGIGRALMAHAQGAYPSLTLYAHAANHDARRFYGAAGFRPTGFGAANDEGLTEIRYQWEQVA